jgi:hypothetical protein
MPDSESWTAEKQEREPALHGGDSFKQPGSQLRSNVKPISSVVSGLQDLGRRDHFAPVITTSQPWKSRLLRSLVVKNVTI